MREKNLMRTRLAALVTAALLSSVAADRGLTQTPRPLALADLAELREVSDPQRSPDGQWVAYVVTMSDFEKDKRHSDVWMVSWDGKRRVRLTSSPDDEENPRWSPDGRYLAFTASRDEEEDAQVRLLDRAGGESQKLTDVKGDVNEYAWSPDGKRLVLAVEDPDPGEVTEKEKKEGKPATKPPIVIDRYHFKQDEDGYLGAQRTHLYLFDVERRAVETLTAGTWDETAPAWSPDGRWIAFLSRRGPDADRSASKDVWVVEAKSGAEPRQVTTSTNPDEALVTWSPDGKTLAYLAGDEPRFYAYNQRRLAVVPLGGGTPKVLTGSLDRSVLVGAVEPGWQGALRDRRGRPRAVRGARAGGRRADRAADDRPPSGAQCVDRRRRPACGGRRNGRAACRGPRPGGRAAPPSLGTQRGMAEARAGRDRRGLHGQGERRHGRQRADLQAAVLRRRHEVPDRYSSSTGGRTARTSTSSTSRLSGSPPTGTRCCR